MNVDKISKIMPKKTKKHTKRVVQLCKKFTKKLSLKKDRRKKLIEAAQLHDIAKKKKEDDRHHKKNAVLLTLEDIEYEYDCDFDVDDDVLNIIECHRKRFKPKEKNQMEAAILRICDTLDKYKKMEEEIEDIEEKCNKVLEYVNDNFDEGISEKFNKIYNELKDKGKNKLLERLNDMN